MFPLKVPNIRRLYKLGTLTIGQLTDNGVIAASSLLKCADGAEVRCGELVQEAELNPWLDVSYLSRKRKKAQAIIEETRYYSYR